MARKSLLLVDADPRSLRVLEVSLRKAGYNLATCGDVKTALETVEYSPPDLIVLDTRLPGPSGFELVESLRKNPDWATIPMIFLSSDTSVESKVRGLQLGVEDYLTKPIYIKEIVARINLTLARVERESVARRSSLAKTRFAGSLSDMGLVDLLQTIDISRKSGVLELRSGQRSGMVTFRDGQVLDAELGSFFGERAIYRLLLWNEGEFAIDFRPVRVEQRVQVPTQGLLMEGMRRLDEWGRLCEQIPPLQSVLEVQAEELTARLAELPDEINGILKMFDGNRSIQDVVDVVEADDLSTLSAISKLFFEGIVQPTGRVTTLRPPELGPHGDEVVPTTTASGDLPAEDPERAIVDEDRMTVPGHASVAPPPMQASPSIVPAPDLSDPAASVVPGALAVPAVPSLGVTSGTGMAPAMAGGATPAVAQSVAEAGTPAHPPGGASARLPKTTLIGPGFEAEQLASSAAGAASLESPSTTSDDNEDVMSKKKRKNRGGSGDQRERRVETEVARKEEPAKKEEVAKKAEAASEDNVIQFPAKRSVTAVAANDDIVEAPAAGAREDDTASRRREEKGRDEKREDEKAREETKEGKPLPGELPRVRLDEDEDDGLPAAIAAPPPDARDRRDERRRKKNATTSSGEIRALGTGEHQAAATDFFTSGKGPVIEEPDDFSDLTRTATPMAKESKQWMYGTIGIFVFFAVGIGAYWYYQNVHLPQPVELGHARRTMPTLPPPSSGSATVAPSAGTETEPAAEGVEPAVEPVAEGVEPAVEPVAEGVEPVAVEPVAEGVEPVAVEPGAEGVEPVAVEPVAVEPTVEPAVEPAAGESYDSVLAEAEAARRRPSTAIPLYERAIELNPSGTAALSQLSYLLINRGRGDDVRRAAGYAERATTLDSSDSLAWLVLGVARETLGDRVGARAAYRACVEQGAPGRWQNECRPHAR